jgi:endonuclease/exonuclease/phosphatase family metal-dependent hydrolase
MRDPALLAFVGRGGLVGVVGVVTAMLFAGCAAEPAQMRLLQANVGNALLSCGDDYVYKLCETDVEARIAERIAEHAPDVVVLQEVLGAGQCDGFEETEADRTCHADHRADEAEQVRRLLGADFTIACDSRNGYECIGVRTSFASVSGCDDGALCRDTKTPPAVEDCPVGFSMSAVELTVEGREPFTLVNGHPDSNPGGDCRRAQLEQTFEGQDPLIDTTRTMLSGDFNLDPDLDTDPSVELWVQWVGDDDDGLRFRYHSGHKERSPPYPTSPTVLGDRVLDHVASDFAEGVCETLGEAPNTERLDGGAGMDHRALLCALTFD